MSQQVSKVLIVAFLPPSLSGGYSSLGPDAALRKVVAQAGGSRLEARQLVLFPKQLCLVSRHSRSFVSLLLTCISDVISQILIARATRARAQMSKKLTQGHWDLGAQSKM